MKWNKDIGEARLQACGLYQAVCSGDYSLVSHYLHLLLRPWQEDDLDPLVRLLAKPEVARYIHLDGQAFTWEETAQVHKRIVGSWNEQGLGAFAVIDKTSGSWIGKLGLMYQEDWPGPDKFEVDYELDPAFWGRGLATECMQAALRYGFVNRSLPHIIGATVPENLASRRVMEKCGLTYQGELRFRNAPLCGMRSMLPPGGKDPVVFDGA